MRIKLFKINLKFFSRNQCYCGDSGYDSQGKNGAGMTNCMTKCKGDRGQYCGGQNSIYVYGTQTTTLQTVYNT